jgi:hypothetical protein
MNRLLTPRLTGKKISLTVSDFPFSVRFQY